MQYQKILFATDFSPASEAALQYATSLAHDAGATLLILHVEELPLPYAGSEVYLTQLPYPDPELRKRLESIVPADRSVRCQHRIVQGMPGEGIVRVAQDERADLIVIGTHGRSGLSRVLMGSVAEAVMRRASCPVLTIKQAVQKPVAVT
jgi:universal stress protein A